MLHYCLAKKNNIKVFILNQHKFHSIFYRKPRPFKKNFFFLFVKFTFILKALCSIKIILLTFRFEIVKCLGSSNELLKISLLVLLVEEVFSVKRKCFFKKDRKDLKAEDFRCFSALENGLRSEKAKNYLHFLS